MTGHASLKPPSRTYAEVDLGAVRHNVRTLSRRAPGSCLMAVVKANAYGHGAAPVAVAALEAGADSLAVATAEEGVELRRAGIAVLAKALVDPQYIDELVRQVVLRAVARLKSDGRPDRDRRNR